MDPDQVPNIGRKFASEDDAYEFYKAYAHSLGFSVRKHLIKRTGTGKVKRRTFCCSKEGEKGVDKRREQVAYERPILRVGCLAQMTCILNKDDLFEIISFEESHSHELTPTPMKHMLRSNRKLTYAQKGLADDAERAGLSAKSTINLLAVQNGGRAHIGFSDSDYYNHISSQRRAKMIKGDARAIMDHFRKIQSEDPSFIYSVELDDNDLIMNMFWTDGRSIVDYKYFGDVLCFDTTYRTNKYGRPFAPFVGVNHLKQTIIFGAALLYEETTTSFKWLFDAFFSAMGGKHPKTVLTDQSAAMASAIQEVFPQTHHRLCVWHIYQNAAKHLNHAFKSKQFTNEFSSCVYGYEDEEEWFTAWNNMLERHGLENNEWLHGIFSEKEKWAMVYGRHMFTADMKSTQRSESMNNVLKKYLKTKHNMLYFFDHYTRLLEDRRYDELSAEFKMRHTRPVLRLNVEMLRQASELYTPKVFKMFEEEYMKSLDCTTEKISKSEVEVQYKVKYGGRTIEHRVHFEPSSQIVECSCMKFSFVGILCAHALKVLDKKNIKRIPEQYILQRWTKDAKFGVLRSSKSFQAHGSSESSVGKQYFTLNYNFREISTLAAESDGMYDHASEAFSKLLKELQEMKQSSGSESFMRSDNQESETAETFCSNREYYPIAVGVKMKATVGRPKKRLKGALEKRNKRHNTKSKKQDKNKKTRCPQQVESNIEVQHQSNQNASNDDFLETPHMEYSYDPNQTMGDHHHAYQNLVSDHAINTHEGNWNDGVPLNNISYTQLLLGVQRQPQ